MPARVLSLSNWRSEDRSAARATQGAGPQQVHMFAGIVESVGKIVELGRTARRADSAGQAWCLKIELGELLDDLAPGASVAINGVCLTLTAPSGSVGAFDVIPETWRRTTLQYASVGDGVNLERSLRAGDRIDGHFVQGHVDATGEIASIEKEDDALLINVRAPASVMRYVVEKGFVAVDGTSL
ncbi:MAG: riboflavin synthase, partial [Planctomycetes bacterium]|nr:riboflavin synthase [Planctomycetota bacterium]